MRRFALLSLTVLVGLVAPTAAVAKPGTTRYLAPPGNSAVTQYLEVVPSPGGPAQPDLSAKPSTGLSPHELHRLNGLGVGGRTLAAVVAVTTPPPSPSSSRSELASHGSTGTPGSGASGGSGSSADKRGATESPVVVTPLEKTPGSPVSAVLAAATGREVGGGVGILLPLLAAGALLSVVGAGIWRRRGQRS